MNRYELFLYINFTFFTASATTYINSKKELQPLQRD